MWKVGSKLLSTAEVALSPQTQVLPIAGLLVMLKADDCVTCQTIAHASTKRLFAVPELYIHCYTPTKSCTICPSR